jgi:hypothetical protein
LADDWDRLRPDPKSKIVSDVVLVVVAKLDVLVSSKAEQERKRSRENDATAAAAAAAKYRRGGENRKELNSEGTRDCHQLCIMPRPVKQ